MFKSKRRPIVIPQSEHLRLVGALAMLWGNEEFDIPPVERNSMVAAMGLHDRGYGLLDNSAIGEMNEEEWLGIARRSFSMYSSDIIADTIVKYHITRLSSYSDTDERKAMTAEFSQTISEQLKSHNLSKEVFDRMDRITELTDNISFTFCFDVPDSDTVSIFPQNRQDREVSVQYRVEDGVIHVTPRPLSVDRYNGYILAYPLDGYPERLDPFILPYRLERK
ncbi:MAG: DUF3891 family protein [Anaerolineae bacterium]|nr:DUF3891 family protein [Anaerolineae bacterium]